MMNDEDELLVTKSFLIFIELSVECKNVMGHKMSKHSLYRRLRSSIVFCKSNEAPHASRKCSRIVNVACQIKASPMRLLVSTKEHLRLSLIAFPWRVKLNSVYLSQRSIERLTFCQLSFQRVSENRAFTKRRVEESLSGVVLQAVTHLLNQFFWCVESCIVILTLAIVMLDVIKCRIIILIHNL